MYDNLTDEQRAVALAPLDKSIRVLAGPGAGKTHTIKHRIRHLLEEGVSYTNILVVTFNKTMATEMGSKILEFTSDLLSPAEQERFLKNICTIHAACYRMLPRSNVAKEWQIKKTIQDIAENLWDERKERPGWKEIYHWINLAKSRGLSADNDREFFVDNLGLYHGEKLDKARKQFDQGLNSFQIGKNRSISLTTFPDMILNVEMKLRNDRMFRERYQEQYEYVIVDEGQDTSAQAMRILSTLAEPQNRFLIVGDTDQLLYRFAGATPEKNLYDGFVERYPDGLTFKLTTNFRSTRTIVNAQKQLIAFNYSDKGGRYDQGYFKELKARSDAEEGERVFFNEHESAEEEAQAIAEEIRTLVDSGEYDYGDIFIGARTRAQLGFVENPLAGMEIPYLNITGGGFWTQPHIRNVVNYIRFAMDQEDNDAFRDIANIASKWMTVPFSNSPQYGEYCSHRYIGKAFWDLCYGKWQFVGRAVSAKPWLYKTGIEDLEMLLREIQNTLELGAISAINAVMDNCYLDYLKYEEGFEVEEENGKLDDISTLKSLASKFQTVEEFLAHADKMEELAKRANDKDWSGKVVLSTVHRLKGLERKIVFGIGFSEGIAKKKDVGNVKMSPAGLLPHTFSLVEPTQYGILPVGGKGLVEDERCIAFVCVSRAMERAYVSSIIGYKDCKFNPSRFVNEMGLIT